MNANRAGQVAEDVLAAVLRSIGLAFERQARIGTSIYGTNLRADFVAYNVVGYSHGLIVESKWQDRDGSVDEKFPYLLENIRQCYPLPAVVIVHGGAARPGAIDWLRSRVDGDKLVGVFGLEEFISWAHRKVCA